MADDRTTTALRQALRAEDATAPALGVDRIQALRFTAERRRAQAAALPGERTGPARRWPRIVAVAAAMVLLFVGGVVLGTDPPAPLRDAGNEVGLPVDSAELATTRDRLDDLGTALSAASQAKAAGTLDDAEFDAIARADLAMLDSVGRLDTGEQAEIKPVAHLVHLQAVRFFDDHGRRLPAAKPEDLDEIGRGGAGN